MENDQKIIKKKSPYTVGETMNKLETLLKEKDIEIFSKIDHFQNAKKAGLDMNESQVLTFGKPQAGTPLMRENIFLSLDLPPKIAVLQDDPGDVWIAYNPTKNLKKKFNLSDSEILNKIDKLIEEISDLAIK